MPYLRIALASLWASLLLRFGRRFCFALGVAFAPPIKRPAPSGRIQSYYTTSPSNCNACRQNINHNQATTDANWQNSRQILPPITETADWLWAEPIQKCDIVHKKSLDFDDMAEFCLYFYGQFPESLWAEPITAAPFPLYLFKKLKCKGFEKLTHEICSKSEA